MSLSAALALSDHDANPTPHAAPVRTAAPPPPPPSAVAPPPPPPLPAARGLLPSASAPVLGGLADAFGTPTRRSPAHPPPRAALNLPPKGGGSRRLRELSTKLAPIRLGAAQADDGWIVQDAGECAVGCHNPAASQPPSRGAGLSMPGK